MREAVFQEVETRMGTDESIMVLTGDLGYGLLESIRDKYPKRFINMGISEQNMISVAAGLSMAGRKVFCYSIGNFPTMRCLEQVRNDVCYHNCDVKIICVGSGLAYGSLGMTHHATEDLAIMRSLPNMEILSPADSLEARQVTRYCLEKSGPAYLRLNKKGEETLLPECRSLKIPEPVLRSDSACGDIALFSTGAISSECQKAVGLLKERDIAVSFATFPTVKPIDKDFILFSAKNSKIIVTVEEHNLSGGFGSAVAEVIAGNMNDCRLIRIGIPDTFISVAGSQAFLRKELRLDARSIANRCVTALQEMAYEVN